MAARTNTLEMPCTSAGLPSQTHESPQPGSALKLLAYVHLRNIYGSTGAGRTARQLVEQLALRSDVDLRVLADARDKARTLPLVQEPWTNFRYHTFVSDTSRQQARWFLQDRPQAETFWPEAQVVFCSGESYVPVRKAALAVTAHDAAYFDEGAHRRDLQYWKTRVKWRLLFEKLVRRADMIHTVSQFSADRLAHFFPGIASRIRVVHNGVASQFFDPVSDAGAVFLKENLWTKAGFILVPGGLHFRKNAELILEAAPRLLQRFSNMTIAVVNHSDRAYLAQAQRLGERFRLLGFVSDEVLHALYATASLVWFPSRYEGFGLPVVEAMACGAPVVASRSSAIPEIAGDDALLANPTDPQAHVDAISALLTDERMQTHLSQAGRARAQNFHWSRSAQELKHHFDSLL